MTTPVPPVGRRLATLAVAAKYMDTSSRTVRRMISRGDLVGYKLPGSTLVRLDLNEIDVALSVIPRDMLEAE